MRTSLKTKGFDTNQLTAAKLVISQPKVTTFIHISHFNRMEVGFITRIENYSHLYVNHTFLAKGLFDYNEQKNPVI